MQEKRSSNVSGVPKIFKYAAIGFALIVLFSILTRTTFLTIEPGHKAVKFKRFAGGVETEKVYGQGFHVIAPWDKMFIYDVRINEDYEKMEVLSKNGLNITIDLSFRYYPVAESIGLLHNQVGTDYMERIIRPEIRSATREVIGKYLPEELYSTKRDTIQVEMFDKTAAELAEKNIELDAILIRQVKLPATLEASIEKKLKQEQESLEYDFRIDKERKEAERKIIEAEAKSAANEILNKSLTSNILRDKGIEATLELANSPNTKVVIVGGGEEGLPLILGNN